MSPSELVATVIGLAVGYLLINRMLGGRSDRADSAGHDLRDATAESDGDQHPRIHDALHERPWWIVLAVPRIATREEIARAYERSLSEYQPDNFADLDDEGKALAKRRVSEIRAAYDEAMRQVS